MKLPILFLAAAMMLQAAVTGVVINKTTGKPQAGVSVTLTNFGAGGMEGEVDALGIGGGLAKRQFALAPSAGCVRRRIGGGFAADGR